MIPSMTEEINKKLINAKIYSAFELGRMEPAVLIKVTGIPKKTADILIKDTTAVMAVLKLRSECKKFMKQFVPPKRGRSHTKVMTAFIASGMNSIEDVSKGSIETLKKAGLTEEESTTLKTEATLLTCKNRMKEMGIPAASLKKYQEAGFISHEDLISSHPAYISIKTGISVETVSKHILFVAEALKSDPPVKISKKQLEKGREEILSLKGAGETMLEQFYRAGIVDLKTLRAANVDRVAKISGLTKDKIRQFQAAAQA
ncbi:MAG: hypothetical protein CVV33_03400 [Methanomicrobiales archaeon HGW-Methanomicrobiales-4]|nr:MAG: hypothetical protein CVV33_03400 [Methanomicrobiales archaeon HGW-Methanomicrobiales-4]